MRGERVRAFLKECQVEFIETEHPRAVGAQWVAHLEHETGWRIAKPVMIKLGQRIAMAVVPAPVQLDLSKLRIALGRDDVALATEEEFAHLFPDCEVGAEPPLGQLYGITVFMDRSLRLDPYLVFRDGTHERTLRVATSDYLRIVRPAELDLGILPVAGVPRREEPLLDDVPG